jgi:hypothetical protein
MKQKNLNHENEPEPLFHTNPQNHNPKIRKKKEPGLDVVFIVADSDYCRRNLHPAKRQK